MLDALLRRNVIFSIVNNRSMRINIIKFLHKSYKLVFEYVDKIDEHFNERKKKSFNDYNIQSNSDLGSYKITIT